MAAEQKGAGAGTRKIKPDDLTAKVVADPKTPVDAILVTGFLGDSSETDHVRIYWDASMASYVDVAAADIVHTEPLPKDQSPLGGSYIWLKRGASGLSGGQGGNPMTGRFFEGPLMAAYGAQFGGAAPAAAGPGGTINVAYSYYIACHPTIQLYCPSVLSPCASPLCTRTVYDCTLLCPVLTAHCPVASPGCPPVGPGTPVQGTPVQGQAAAMADPAAAGAALVGSYAPHCWYSWNACPTMYGGCGPHHTPGCPQFQAQAPAAAGAEAAAGAAVVGSYAPHCWYSWNACPTMYGGCGPHHTPGCPQFQVQAAAAPAAQGVVGSYAPHCWYSWNACPTMYGGCGPHQSHIYCPTQLQAQAQAPAAAAALPGGATGFVGSYAPHCWYSWNACPTLYGGCGPHHTPGCPQFQAAQAPAAPAAQAGAVGSYAPHCWYSWGACPTMYGCGPFHTPNCPR